MPAVSSARDLGVPDFTTLHRILDAVDAAIAAGMPVYVCCRDGTRRTGAVRAAAAVSVHDDLATGQAGSGRQGGSAGRGAVAASGLNLEIVKNA